MTGAGKPFLDPIDQSPHRKTVSEREWKSYDAKPHLRKLDDGNYNNVNNRKKGNDYPKTRITFDNVQLRLNERGKNTQCHTSGKGCFWIRHPSDEKDEYQYT